MFESLLQTTDTATLGYVLDVWNRFNAAANTWLTAMMIIFVIVMGYLLIMGRINLSMAELSPRVLKLAVIFVLVTNVGLLVTVIYNLFTEVPQAVATFLVSPAGETEININGMIDLVWDRGMNSAENIFDQGGIASWGPWIFAGLVAGVTIALFVYVCFLLMLSKLAVAVLLAVAPFFIVLYLFDATRSVFEGWLRQLISFALIPIFLYALLALVLSIADGVSERLLASTEVGAASLTQVAPFAVVMLVTLLLTTQVMGWSAGIGNGLALSSLGVERKAASLGLGAAKWGLGVGEQNSKGTARAGSGSNRTSSPDGNSWPSRQRRGSRD